MYARLRQKAVWSGNAATIASPQNLGTISTSLMMKDIGRIITGLVTNVSGLNSNIWDTANSEIVNTVAPGWSEYQSNYLTTSTDVVPSSSTNSNMIYLRGTSANTTSGSAPIYKYTGLGWANNGLPQNNLGWNFFNPWYTTDYTGSPTLTFRENQQSGAAAGRGRNGFSPDTLAEYIIYATPRAIFISACNFGTLTAPHKVCMFLEHPSTPLSQTYNLPNQVWWEVGNPYVTNTGTGAAFVNTGYLTVGGYLPGVGSDITQATTSNANFAFVYTNYQGGPGFTSLWSSASATGDLSTLKPTTYTSMANTVNSSGATISVPVLPLLHFPPWDSVYDLSSLTGIYGTKSGLGANGDTLTVNGQNYAYINATTMGYLIPRQ